MVKVLPEPVTPSSTCERSLRLAPSTRSLIADGWSPFGCSSDLSSILTPPSDLSGRGGRCGVHTAVPPLDANSGRPSRSSFSSACIDAVTPSVTGWGEGRCICRFSRRGSEMSEISSRSGWLVRLHANQRLVRIALVISQRLAQLGVDLERRLRRIVPLRCLVEPFHHRFARGVLTPPVGAALE